MNKFYVASLVELKTKHCEEIIGGFVPAVFAIAAGLPVASMILSEGILKLRAHLSSHQAILGAFSNQCQIYQNEISGYSGDDTEKTSKFFSDFKYSTRLEPFMKALPEAQKALVQELQKFKTNTVPKSPQLCIFYQLYAQSTYIEHTQIFIQRNRKLYLTKAFFAGLCASAVYLAYHAYKGGFFKKIMAWIKGS